MANMKERQLQDQAFWEQQEKERIAAAIEERRIAVANRERLGRMKPDKDAFLEKLLKERNIVYEVSGEVFLDCFWGFWDKLSFEFRKNLRDFRVCFECF